MFKQLVDSQLNLVFLQASLAEELFEIIDSNRAYLSEWLAWPVKTLNVADTRDFIHSAITGFAENRMMICAIEFQEEIIGIAGFNTIEPSLKKVELGYWISSQYQGRGIITRTCDFLCHYAFEELSVEKIQFAAATDNIASRNVAERLNFKLEGIITNAESLNGRIVDHAVYGLLSPSH